MSTALKRQSIAAFGAGPVFGGTEEQDTKFFAGVIRFNDYVLGGRPGNPDLAQAWIRSKIKSLEANRDAIVDERYKQHLLGVLEAHGVAADEGMPIEALEKAAEPLVAEQRTLNVFAADAHGLYLESRQLKAAIKEATLSRFPGLQISRTKNAKGEDSGKKSIKSVVEEVFNVYPARLHLGRQEPDRIIQQVGVHVDPRTGQRQSSITYIEANYRPAFRFYCSITFAEQLAPYIPLVWLHAQRIGLGASRSMSYGRFTLVHWQEVPPFNETDIQPEVIETDEHRHPDDLAVPAEGDAVSPEEAEAVLTLGGRLDGAVN